LKEYDGSEGEDAHELSQKHACGLVKKRSSVTHGFCMMQKKHQNCIFGKNSCTFDIFCGANLAKLGHNSKSAIFFVVGLPARMDGQSLCSRLDILPL
jgi:hypothetical protein